MKKIDAHAHVGYFGGRCQEGQTAEELTAEMSRYDIAKSLISFTDNELVAQSVNRDPDSLAGLALNQLDRLVTRAPFVGLKLYPLLNAFTANDAAAHPLMDYAKARDWPVFIHYGYTRRSRCPGASPSWPPPTPRCE